jgi:phospholipid/cholesterol/gamma-HCH transport system ATP-binding protein
MESTSDIAISVKDVCKSFNSNEVLRGITMDVPTGTTAAVMGASGSGKSVLIKTIVRLLEPDSGEVRVRGQRIDQLDEDELARARLAMGYLFQGGALFDSMTVYGNLDFILKRHSDLKGGLRRQAVLETLEWVMLADHAHKFPSELSGGQRKRVALARAIVLQPKVLFYDEPTTGLDPVTVRAVSELIALSRDDRGVSSIVITHDVLCAEIVADHVFFLHEGRLLADGSLEEVRRSAVPEVSNFFKESR